MKLDMCQKLLNLFYENGIEFGLEKLSFPQVLDLDEEVVKKILRLKGYYQLDAISSILYEFDRYYKQRCPLKFQLKACDLVKACETELHAKALYEILCNDDLLDKNVAFPSASMIVKIKEPWRMEHAVDVLESMPLIKRGLSLEGAKLVLLAPDEIKAWGISFILGCEDTVQSGIAFEGARMILEAEESFQVENMTSLLWNKNVLLAEVALKGAKLILETKEAYQAKKIYSVLSNKDVIDGGFALEGAKMFLQTKEEYQANYIRDILSDVTFIEEGVTLAGAGMILDTENEEEAKRVREYLDSIYPKKEETIHQEEKDFKKMLSNMYVEEGLQLLSSLPSSFEEVNSKKVLSYVKKKDFK